ncbi:MFS transporter [Gluconacetobacter sacchari]|uniref:MFS transporter n=2 Tax=Gluconacetobacter sacchari TaxID=92759 RepID=A0A7W4IBQ0_9PROT|nr:MFS transporter [Gluconacetobacter sacchari]MBB2159893.1 MFS transporter [Gluconacetobacter sacchari]
MRRATLASIGGNVLEYFDFIMYAHFAREIGSTFFPPGVRFSQTTAALAAFGLTCCARPVGAWILGGYADRKGRLRSLRVSIVIMTTATFVLATVPGYARIGLLAPAVIMLARFCQGLSMGGEFGSATAFLIESRPAHATRAASWQAIGQILASLGALAVTFGLRQVLPAGASDETGFRIAFGIGTLLGILALLARMGAEPTPPRGPAARGMPAPPADARFCLRVVTVGSMVALGAGITYFGLAMLAYAQSELHVPADIPLYASVISVVGQLAFTPLRWRLANRFDRTGRIVPSLAGCGLVAVLSLCAACAVGRHPGLVLVLPLGLNLLGLSYFAPLDGQMGLVFPAAQRGRGLAIGYACGVVLFGTLLPFLIGWLSGGVPVVRSWVRNCSRGWLFWC